MNGVTINLLVEITKNGQTNTYKVSNGANLSGVVTEKDLMNLINLSAKQVLSQAHVDTDKHLRTLDAQDALIVED